MRVIQSVSVQGPAERRPRKPDQATNEPFTDVEYSHHMNDGGSSPARSQKFPPANSFNTAFSSSASARSFLSCRFCFFRCFSFFASSAVRPPNWLRHRQHVGSVTVSAFDTAATSPPSARIRSVSWIFPTIYSGECRWLRFVMIFIVFLPANAGRKTTLITLGPKKWIHANQGKGCELSRRLLIRSFLGAAIAKGTVGPHSFGFDC